MRRYRLEIVEVSEARWNQFGETELATGELFIHILGERGEQRA